MCEPSPRQDGNMEIFQGDLQRMRVPLSLPFTDRLFKQENKIEYFNRMYRAVRRIQSHSQRGAVI